MYWVVRTGLTEKVRVERTASTKDLRWEIAGIVRNQ